MKSKLPVSRIRIVFRGDREAFERLLRADKDELSKCLGHKIVRIEEVKAPVTDKERNSSDEIL